MTLSAFLDAAGTLLIALALALPIGWERERRTRLMGLRTFPLVSVATCAYVLIALHFAPQVDEAQARILQGLITGMGFIGGGAILRGQQGIHGTATAASLWATGAVGAAVAFGNLGLALAVSVLIFLMLQLLTMLERRLGMEKEAARAAHDADGADAAAPGAGFA